MQVCHDHSFYPQLNYTPPFAFNYHEIMLVEGTTRTQVLLYRCESISFTAIVHSGVINILLWKNNNLVNTNIKGCRVIHT